MSVIKILEWIINSHNIITSCVLLMFAVSLLWLIVRGKSK